MTVNVLHSPEDLRALRLEWLALWRDCPAATPFQSPQWLLPWTAHLFGGGRILAVTLREGSHLTGFAPLFLWGTERRTVSFLGAGVSDYGDLLFTPGRERDCVDAVRRFLAGQCPGWDLLDLRELRENCELLSAFADTSYACRLSVCPVLDLATYPASMDAKHRTDVRRARNKVSKLPDAHFTLAEPATLRHHLDKFFRLYETRWGTLDSTLRQFHAEVAGAFLETGNLRLSLLGIAGRPAAAIYAITAGQTLYCYLSSFDPDMAKQSPGAVLLGWVIEHAVSEGLRQVDFLRDPEPYKYLWGARDRANYSLRLPGDAARLLTPG